jgi:hypothetical protein
VSAQARLGAFLLLLAALFCGAFAVGHQLGPVNVTYLHSGGGTMNMSGSSGQPRPADQRR